MLESRCRSSLLMVARLLLTIFVAVSRWDTCGGTEDIPGYSRHVGVSYWHERVGTHHSHFHSGEFNHSRYSHHYEAMKLSLVNASTAPPPTGTGKSGGGNNTSPAGGEGGGEGKGGVVFEDSDKAGLTAAMIKLLKGTATTREWLRNTLVRNEFKAFQAKCGGVAGFVEALVRYLAVYFHALDPEVPPEDKRVLVVRDTMARINVGLGIQMAFKAKWLLLGMATDRAVFFQFCQEDDLAEAWVENRNYPPPPGCDTAHYDLGDFFGLLGGVDLRWTPARAQALRAQGLTHHLVSACSTAVNLTSSPTRRFMCDCCAEACMDHLRNLTGKHGIPPPIKAAVHDFWTKGEADGLPWITFEDRSECRISDAHGYAASWRGDPRANWYTAELDDILKSLADAPAPARCAAPGRCVSGGFLPQGWARVERDLGQAGSELRGIKPMMDLLLWADCARFAMHVPTPQMQQVLSLPTMLPRLEAAARRVVAGLHLRTMEVDFPSCMPSDLPLSAEAVDAAWDRSTPETQDNGRSGAGHMDLCRRGATACDAGDSPFPASPKAVFATDLFGGLSGFIECAHKVSGLNITLKRGQGEVDPGSPAMMVASTDAESLALFLKEHYSQFLVSPEGGRIMPLWNNPYKCNVIKNRRGHHSSECNEVEQAEALDEEEEFQLGWLKGALDMYMLGLSDVIFAPVDSSFTISAATRSLKLTPVFGHHSELCKMLSSYETRDNKIFNRIRSDLAPFKQCFTADIDLDGDASRAIQIITTKAEQHEHPEVIDRVQAERAAALHAYNNMLRKHKAAEERAREAEEKAKEVKAKDGSLSP